MDDELDARESERARRRDREAAEKDREPMRTGIGKVFKQIQDAQVKAARNAAKTPPTSRKRKRD
jgi:hypothetical protein